MLVPEIWIAFSEATGIPELRRTTRDEPDYDVLMVDDPWMPALIGDRRSGGDRLYPLQFDAEECEQSVHPSLSGKVSDYGAKTMTKPTTAHPAPAHVTLAVVLQVRNGVLQVLHYEEGKHFSQHDLELLTLLASHASLAVENVHLLEQAQREIAERKQAEEQLRESRALMQSIMEHFPGLISAKDLIGTVIMTNSRFEVLEGSSPEEFVGKNVYDLFPKEVADVLWANDLAVQRAGHALSSEEIVAHKDGSWHTYFTTQFPLYKGQGEMFATCAISTDITDFKQAEITLRENEEKLQILFDTVTEGIALNVEVNTLDAANSTSGGVYISDWTDLGECHDHDGVHRTSGRIYKVTYGKPLRPAIADVSKLHDADLVDLQLGRVVVGRVLDQLDAVLRRPGVELVGAVADQVAGVGAEAVRHDIARLHHRHNLGHLRRREGVGLEQLRRREGVGLGRFVGLDVVGTRAQGAVGLVTTAEIGVFGGSGFSAFLAKPARPDALLGLIDRLLAG